MKKLVLVLVLCFGIHAEEDDLYQEMRGDSVQSVVDAEIYLVDLGVSWRIADSLSRRYMQYLEMVRYYEQWYRDHQESRIKEFKERIEEV